MVGKNSGLNPFRKANIERLEHCSIAGSDMKWVWADAKIYGEIVAIISPDVGERIAVRYAFTMNPARANFYDQDRLPAAPFRTDNWSGPSKTLKWHLLGEGKKIAKSCSGSDTEILFTNRAYYKVKILWIEFGGAAKMYGEMDSGATRTQNTYSNSSWLITNEQDKPFGSFRTTGKIGHAIIPKD